MERDKQKSTTDIQPSNRDSEVINMTGPDQRLICHTRRKLAEALFASDVEDDLEKMRDIIAMQLYDDINKRANEIVDEFLASQNY